MGKIAMFGAVLLMILGAGACASPPKVPPPSDPRACGPATSRAGELSRSGSIDVLPGRSTCLRLKGDARQVALQMTDDGAGTTLLVHNPYPEVLTFTALVYLENGDGGFPSTTCPVKPGATGSEQWEEDLSRVMLSRFELHAPEKAPTECE